MDRERAKELAKNRERFRLYMPGVGKRYRLAKVMEYDPVKQTALIEYDPPRLHTSPMHKTADVRFPLELLQEFNGPWKSEDLKYQNNGSRRTKGNAVGRAQTPEDRPTYRRTRLKRRRTK